jgi:hypothetical protein
MLKPLLPASGLSGDTVHKELGKVKWGQKGEPQKNRKKHQNLVVCVCVCVCVRATEERLSKDTARK